MQGVITKENRDDGLLKFEFEKRVLGNAHDDNNIKVTQLKQLLLKMNKTTRLKLLLGKIRTEQLSILKYSEDQVLLQNLYLFEYHKFFLQGGVMFSLF